MIKKMKRSIEKMPRPAYIFIKNVFILCDAVLLISLLLFISSDGAVESYEITKLAQLCLETPSGMLLLSLIGLAFIIDRS